MSILIEYVRDSSNKRVGVVVALNSEDIGKPNIGWSRCNWRDKFDKKKALDIAIGRAKKRRLFKDNSYTQNDSVFNVPPSMIDGIEKMRGRMKKYFQESLEFDDTLADIDPHPRLYDSGEWSPK